MNLTLIGGGVIGLTLANLLANSPYQITLVDQGHPPQTGLKTPYDLRVAAINHASEQIFRSINTWHSLASLRISPYEKMHVWDENSPANLTFNCFDVSKKHLGHIIEYNVLRQALYQPLLSHKNVHLCYDTKPITLQEIQDGIVLTLENGELLHTTQLVIGADGGDSWVARQAGIANNPHPYHQSALVTTLSTEKPHQKTAWQRFLGTGPLAFLPLADPHQVSIVWSTLPAHANHLATLTEAAFNQLVAKEFEHQLGDVEVQDQRIVFPLIQRHATRYTQSRIALVGDAAHTIHPLAGLGMNLGLLDAACLAQVLLESAEKKDPGDTSVLRRYERWRKGDNALMIKAMRGFQQLFGSTSSVLTHARYLGFAATEFIPFVKQFFMERAMGLSGDLPVSATARELHF